jgi:hypothetical protein
MNIFELNNRAINLETVEQVGATYGDTRYSSPSTPTFDIRFVSGLSIYVTAKSFSELEEIRKNIIKKMKFGVS